MSLIPESERAEDIADALAKFRRPNHDKVQDINAAIAELNQLSFALRDLDALVEGDRSRRVRMIQDDLDLVHSSLKFTLDDVWELLGRLPPPPLLDRDYRHGWLDIEQYCHSMRKQSLSSRLARYKLFVFALCRLMRRQPPSARQLEDLRGQIRDIRSIQTRPLKPIEDAFRGMTLAPQTTLQKPRSYERRREERPPTPATTESQSDLPYIPSPPLSPLSPTRTFSTFSATSYDSSSAEPTGSHWATNLLKDISSTPLPYSEEASLCFAEPERDGGRWPKEEYDQLLVFKFPEGLKVHFFCRKEDYRARMVCEWASSRGHRRYSVMGLDKIYVTRSGPLMKLYFYSPKNRRQECWARLRFTTIERLIIFHSCVMSLRSHDDGRPCSDIQDHELKDETSFFACPIVDNGYSHILRVYRDRHSKAIRLQSSILSGSMKNTPIWTAFITHSMASRRWMRRAGDRIVCLSELRRHVFSGQYIPHVAPNGEHVLQFEQRKDADDFMGTIDDLAEQYERS